MSDSNSSIDGEPSKSPNFNKTNSESQELISSDNDNHKSSDKTPDLPCYQTKKVSKIGINDKNIKNDDDIEEFDTDEDEPIEKDDKANKQSDSSHYSKHLTYEGDLCIYTEPKTGRQLIWDAKKNSWIPKNEVTENNDDNPMKDYEFDGNNYIYTDKVTNVTYKFNDSKNEWVVKDDKEGKTDNSSAEPDVNNPSGSNNDSVVYGFENDTHTYTDTTDGSVYFWDREKNAWFPKVDDDFIAMYQLNYGFTDQSTTSSSVAQPEIKKIDPKAEKERNKVEAKKKATEPPTWFEIDPVHNTAIYISGLPLDITMEQLVELVGKYGLIARDDKNKDKIKLYRDSEGNPKGDALCTYIKVESVDLALKFLDGTRLGNKTLSVQRAKFQMKGSYDPSLKPKRRKKDKDRQKKIQEKLFDWRPERLPGEPQKCERIVILKNLFTLSDFEQDVTLSLEYKQDIQSECAKCGDVRKVTIYDTNPEGVAKIIFSEPSEAEACIKLLNGRWFGKRKITAELWDGKTKYHVAETEEEAEARINKWDKFLEDEYEKQTQSKTNNVEINSDHQSS
ncbi:HIV Tat-specific factor 1 homolog [Microplitis demolitor]|uniref:HIV Tat-specific factor 1 homolog n=1 Tax=Microplitis demolitor TaxID=69319 RepID=UPI0004CDC7D5|nr:HIV Tat-specific factor 1 homolog [Microplitis demolitor]